MLMDKKHALLKDRVSGWLQIGWVAPSLDVNDTKHLFLTNQSVFPKYLTFLFINGCNDIVN